MKCPACGYVRKPEDNVPEWQCPACQVVYEKVTRSNNYVRPSYNSTSVRTAVNTKPSGISLGSVVIVLVLCVALCAAYFVATGKPIFGMSEQAKSELLTNKKAELKAYEEGLQRVDEEIERNRKNVGICPITGQPNQFVLENDPRPELRKKIEVLNQEIQQLESKS